MSKPTDPKQWAIQRALAILAEEFDNIQILASRMDGSSDLENYEAGIGNILALVSHAEIWAEATKSGLIDSKIESEYEDDDEDEDDEDGEEDDEVGPDKTDVGGSDTDKNSSNLGGDQSPTP